MTGTRDRLEARLEVEGLAPAAWSNGPDDVYAAHEHGYDKVLVCASDLIRFGLPGVGMSVELRPGDRLELPAGTRHDAQVGADGVTCLEAHVPAGQIPTLRRVAAGAW